MPEQLRILVVGQSIASNCNEALYGPVEHVHQIGKDGALKAARDPFEWADCDKGSMWMPLGKLIIEKGLAKSVVFMPIGVGGTRVQDWQSGGRAFPKLDEALALIKKENLVFDAAFWHQGSSDHGMAGAEYAERLNAVIAYVNERARIGQWLIGVHSRCWGRYDANVEAAQRSVGAASAQGRYPGANSNLLGNEYRFDECHLNRQGQEQMAAMWLEALRNARAGK